jgi:hypothetical protein
MSALTNVKYRWALSACLLGLLGCATPAQKFTARAAQDGLLCEELKGQNFRHVVFSKVSQIDDSRALHLYLDGDGTPWAAPGQIALDPSARNALILELMRQDPESAVLLGRPCYYLASPDPACAPPLWTMARYSEPIVASLAIAANQIIARHPHAEVTLIGYSGGGVLATLLAPRLARVTGVLTVAANLDTARWAAYHHYSPLSGSLNPAEQAPLPSAIQQLHLYGAIDRNVPQALSARFLAQQPTAQTNVLPGFDHRCCWAAQWPVLLARFAASP